jgi:hypothetical protein
VAKMVVLPNPFCTVIFIVLKKSKPLFYSSRGVTSAATASTQEGQVTVTKEAE